MSTTKQEFRYRCWNDCYMEGCPSHVATLDYQSVSDALHFDDGKGNEIFMQTPELGALLRMINELGKSRVEIDSEIKGAFGGCAVAPSSEGASDGR